MAQFAFGDCTMFAVGSLWSGALPLNQTNLAVVTLVLGALPAILVYMARRRGWRPVALAVTGMCVALILASLALVDNSCMTAAGQSVSVGLPGPAGSEGASPDNDGAIRLHAVVLGAIIAVGWGVLAGQLLAWFMPAGRPARR